MPINTDFLTRCINTLESAFEQLQQYEPSDTFYDIFRAASVKEFEIVLEQSGSLLKKRLRPYFASNRQADKLTFKNAFRRAAKHGLISVEASERWFAYRKQERHGPRLRREVRRDDAQIVAGFHRRRQGVGKNHSGGCR